MAAQAKINLGLRVLDRESDGYHQIETLFCRLTLADDVTVRLTAGARSLDAEGEAMPDGGLGSVEHNLAWRAAERYMERAGWEGGFAIEIAKRIPVGGGLGGGSADAGAVLRALDAMAPLPLDPPALSQIAASLGADVPFLIAASPLAFGRGRGERLEPLDPLPTREVLLVHFPFGVQTGDAYRWLAESRLAGRPRAAPVPGPVEWESWGAVAKRVSNDFEEVVAPRYPPIATTLAALRSPAARAALGRRGFALLCGSGATVAAIGDADVPAARLAALVPDSVVARRVATATAARVEEVLVVE